MSLREGGVAGDSKMLVRASIAEVAGGGVPERDWSSGGGACSSGLESSCDCCAPSLKSSLRTGEFDLGISRGEFRGDSRGEQGLAPGGSTASTAGRGAVACCGAEVMTSTDIGDVGEGSSLAEVAEARVWSFFTSVTPSLS